MSTVDFTKCVDRRIFFRHEGRMEEAPSHEALIVALGDTGAVAAELGLRDNRVSNWKQRGIAWRYRPRVAALAKRKRVALPEGFLA